MKYHTFNYPHIELQLANDDEMNKLLGSGDPAVKELFDRIAALSNKILLTRLPAQVSELAPRRKRQHLSVDTIEEIQRLYAQGVSRKELAEQFGVHYATIHYHT
jgi:hypothetical protein